MSHISIFALFFTTLSLSAQSTKINWISFEQLEDSLDVKPKKSFISFYADWCVYCKKMDRAAFSDPKVIQELSENYYAVKMNAEATEKIQFDGRFFYNEQVGKKRRPNHQLALILASRKNKPFTLPALIVFDKNFQITGRYFEYQSPKELLEILQKD